MTQLAWGRRYLMCPPAFFSVLYEINPWMHREVSVDIELAHEQWSQLVACVRSAGAEVELLDPVEALPDLVFTANAGLVSKDLFIAARFLHPQRQGETSHDIEWFATRGWRVRELPEGLHQEGAGDALPFGDLFVAGYRTRSDVRSHAELSSLTGVPVRSVELADPRLYHLDLTFCPLDDRRAITVPAGWDEYGRRLVKELVPEPLPLDIDEALSFAANSVVVGRNVVMPGCPPRIGRQLEAWGFEVAVVDVSEFRKAGGGPRCLTLALDVAVGAVGNVGA